MNGRLLLYSDQIPPVTDVIDAALPGRGGTIGYVPSAPDPERFWFNARRAYYARHGLNLRYFGLEEEFDPGATQALFSCDAIHLTGGNTFRFLYWLRQRGMIEPLRRYVTGGGTLIGVSAGAILMTPDIGSSLLCGDTRYPGLEDDGGLALVDFAVVPHYDGADSDLRAYASTFGGDVYGVPDGAGIVVKDGRIRLFGEVAITRSGRITSPCG